MANALLTRKALAVAFRTHPQTVVKWETAGLPVAERGGPGRPSLYALPDAVSWYIARELAARGVDVGALDPKVERALLDRRRREEIEQKLAKTSGELIPRTEFARVLGPIVHRIKVALLATPRAWAPALVKAAAAGPGVVEQTLAGHIRAVLLELAELPVQENAS